MVVTRAKSGAAPKQVDAEVALQKSFASQSLLAWSNGSRGSTKKSGTVRKPQNTALILNLPLDVLAIVRTGSRSYTLRATSDTCPPIDIKPLSSFGPPTIKQDLL